MAVELYIDGGVDVIVPSSVDRRYVARRVQTSITSNINQLLNNPALLFSFIWV